MAFVPGWKIRGKFCSGMNISYSVCGWIFQMTQLKVLVLKNDTPFPYYKNKLMRLYSLSLSPSFPHPPSPSLSLSYIHAHTQTDTCTQCTGMGRTDSMYMCQLYEDAIQNSFFWRFVRMTQSRFFIRIRTPVSIHVRVLLIGHMIK